MSIGHKAIDSIDERAEWTTLISERVHAFAQLLEDKELESFMEDAQAMAASLPRREDWLTLMGDVETRVEAEGLNRHWTGADASKEAEALPSYYYLQGEWRNEGQDLPHTDTRYDVIIRADEAEALAWAVENLERFQHASRGVALMAIPADADRVFVVRDDSRAASSCLPWPFRGEVLGILPYTTEGIAMIIEKFAGHYAPSVKVMRGEK